MNSPFRSRSDREQDREAKREALLQAAVRLFNECGFGKASLEDVAVSLGITKPTIYYYLGNKDQVLLECITRGLGELQEAVAKAREGQGSGRERLESFLLQYARINMTDFGRCTIRTQDHDLSSESAAKFRSLKRSVDRELRLLLEEAAADGSITCADIKLSALAIAGALNGPAFWYDPDGPLDQEAVAASLVAIIVRGFLPDKYRGAD